MRLGQSTWILTGCALVLACASDEPAAPTVPVCTVKNPEECPSPAPTYADVAPLLEERCNTCHSDDSTGPWPLTTYDNVADWWDLVRRDTLNCSMPPPDSGLSLTHDESKLILDWIYCDLPE
jgi:hypothetical protein